MPGVSIKHIELSLVYRKEQEINNLNGKLEDEQSLVAQLQKKIKELTVGDSSCYH